MAIKGLFHVKILFIPIITSTKENHENLQIGKNPPQSNENLLKNKIENPQNSKIQNNNINSIPQKPQDKLNSFKI